MSYSYSHPNKKIPKTVVAILISFFLLISATVADACTPSPPNITIYCPNGASVRVSYQSEVKEKIEGQCQPFSTAVPQIEKIMSGRNIYSLIAIAKPSEANRQKIISRHQLSKSDCYTVKIDTEAGFMIGYKAKQPYCWSSFDSTCLGLVEIAPTHKIIYDLSQGDILSTLTAFIFILTGSILGMGWAKAHFNKHNKSFLHNIQRIEIKTRWRQKPFRLWTAIRITLFILIVIRLIGSFLFFLFLGVTSFASILFHVRLFFIPALITFVIYQNRLWRKQRKTARQASPSEDTTAADHS